MVVSEEGGGANGKERKRGEKKGKGMIIRWKVGGEE